MLKQIERGVRNGPITKNGVFPVSTLFFKKFCFSLRTFYKELNFCTSYPNVNIQIFRKQWSFTLIEQTSLIAVVFPLGSLSN